MLDSVYERIVEIVNSPLIAEDDKREKERDNKLIETKKKRERFCERERER